MIGCPDCGAPLGMPAAGPCANPMHAAEIKIVPQEDESGCGLAVLAMLTGRTYKDVRAEFPERDFHSSGLGISDIWRYLWDRGYYLRVVYENPGGEWPPPPFAAVHFAQVQNEAGNSHAVYMDARGTVADPLASGNTKLSDWPVVNQVVGVRPGPS